MRRAKHSEASATLRRALSNRTLSARVYRYRLRGLAAWHLFVGPVRNRREAVEVLSRMFGDALEVVRAHPRFDPFARKAHEEKRFA